MKSIPKLLYDNPDLVSTCKYKQLMADQNMGKTLEQFSGSTWSILKEALVTTESAVNLTKKLKITKYVDGRLTFRCKESVIIGNTNKRRNILC